MIGRVNTSASLYRIASCLIMIAKSCSNIYLWTCVETSRTCCRIFRRCAQCCNIPYLWWWICCWQNFNKVSAGFDFVRRTKVMQTHKWSDRYGECLHFKCKRKTKETVKRSFENFPKEISFLKRKDSLRSNSKIFSSKTSKQEQHHLIFHAAFP